MAIAANDFDEPERIDGDFRRDKRGTPYVADPDGAIVKSGVRKGETKWLRYGRPSSFGKDIENTYNLQRWNERRIVFGLTVDNEDLTERIVALADLDPDTDEGKDAADAVIVEAKRLAEAHIAAARGTHMHAVTEDDDTDRDWITRAEHGANLGIPEHVQAAMVAAWRKMIAECGFEIIHVEHAVVHDAWRQAGTLDRIARLTKPLAFKDGTVLPAGLVPVLDVKTGKMRTQASGRIEYWHSYGIQLAAYAGAVPYDTDTDQRGTWDVEIDQRYAVIAHLPVDEALQGTARCRLVLVDLEAARDAIEGAVLPAKAWQASDPFAHGVDLEFSVPVVEPEAKPDRSVRHDFSKPAQPTPTKAVDFSRLDASGIAANINFQISRRHVRIDEDDLVSDQQDAEIVRRVHELDQQAKAVLDVLARTAKEAGHPFSRGAGLTTRRWHIYRALLRLGAHFAADLEDHHIRATLALVLPDTAQPGVALGPAIGSLTLEEARRFVQAAIQVMAADAALTIDDAGHPKWLGVGNTAA